MSLTMVSDRLDNEEHKITNDEMMQALQTAAGFSEALIKQMWAKILKKDQDDLFGEETTDIVGMINLDTKPGVTHNSYSLKLDFVDSTDRVDMAQFKSTPYIYDEILRLIKAAELYWTYCIHKYSLPDLSLWRSSWGTLFVAGAPESLQHIGVRVIKR